MNKLKPIKETGYNKILESIIKHIEQSKLRAYSEINKALLQAYWNIGKELSINSAYGKSVVEKLSRDLRFKFPETRGYSVANLWNMKRFYETYQKVQPAAAEFQTDQKLQSVTGELKIPQKLQAQPAELLFGVSWTNHVTILDIAKSPEEREFYIKTCIKERLATRDLKRQINSALFERYMLADKPEKVTALIPKHKSKDIVKHFKDDYVLEFLNLGKNYSEKELEKAILDNLRDFFLEFGKSLTFLGSQYTLDIGGRENRIDLLFFHRELRCLVAVELKIGEFKAEYTGQMQKYLAALDEKVRLPGEKESIGLILCKSKNHEEVRFALAKTASAVKVASYEIKLPDKELILKRLGQYPAKGIMNKN